MVDLIAVHDWILRINALETIMPQTEGDLAVILHARTSITEHVTSTILHDGWSIGMCSAADRGLHICSSPGIFWHMTSPVSVTGGHISDLPLPPTAHQRDVSGMWSAMSVQGEHLIDILEAGSSVNWQAYMKEQIVCLPCTLSGHSAMVLLQGRNSAILMIDSRVLASFWNWFVDTASEVSFSLEVDN